MYKKASERAQQRVNSGRGPLSGSEMPTYTMTGPKPFKVKLRAAKKAAAQAAARKGREEKKAKRAEEQKKLREAEQLERQNARKLRQLEELTNKVRESLLGQSGDGAV
jgi:hypothetical protein